MDAKYSLSRYAITTLAAAMLVMPTACNDDLDYRNNTGQQIAFKLTAADMWYNGMSVNENAPTTHCTSVQALSAGDTKLYLHTVVADNPVKKTVAASRGTLVSAETFNTTYPQFSLSGICYTGEYPEDESQNKWTTEYAYNLIYNSASGTPTEEGRPLLWPSNGRVRFFAFAPTVKDFNDLQTGGSLELSESAKAGSPTLTYTVPSDVTRQIDLMTVSHTAISATTPVVELKFGHALTAVQIKCGKDMLAGKITKVTIAGIHSTGTQVIGSDTWETTSDLATYTITKDITLSADENGTDKIHAPGNTPITGTVSDKLTFLLLPQTLPQGATMTIEFTDDATKTERTISGSIAGHTWQAGKIVTYSISPSSISINAKLNFNKKGAVGDIAGDTIPYSGVWYDAAFSATAEIVQSGVETKTIENIPVDKIKFCYRLNNTDPETTWHDCTQNSAGLLAIKAQVPYDTMNEGFSKETTAGTKDTPFDLSTEYGETANCYLVDKAGYYSLQLVYGNKQTSGGNENGLTYFPGYDDNRFPGTDITDASDAVLLWQDAPDMVDNVCLDESKNNLHFRIRKNTLTQGNAVLAVRNSTHDIIWSWHIWVTPYKTDFYTRSSCYHSQTTCGDETHEYYLAKYNLGWCDRHDGAEARPFSLKAEIDMSAYGGGTQTVDIEGTFTQMEYRGSNAGDNTYYQWGRKDPMLGGIYNSKTPKYSFKNKGTTTKTDEFNMENKQVFNQYVKDGYNYSFRKNIGDMIDIDDEASNGVSIGYAIKHPYLFITNSRSYDVESTLAFSYRNHWHVPYSDEPVPYLSDGTHIMFNAWNATATAPGETALTIQNNLSNTDLLKANAVAVTKSVYDPCPPKFNVPPIDAFRGIAGIIPLNSSKTGTSYGTYTGLSDNISFTDYAWSFTYNGQSITFPATGVRDYALRSNEWKTVQLSGKDVDYDSFYKTTMPAFNQLTFVSSATIAKSSNTSAYQVLLFTFDNRYNISGKPAMHSYNMSSNSSGLPVRPMYTGN